MAQWKRALLVVALVLVSFLTISSAVRGLQQARHLRARTDEPIQPWMNIPYIAHAYHVRPDVIHDALRLPPDQPDRRPLRLIAQSQGRSTDALITDILAAVRRVRDVAQPPEPPAPPAEPRRQP